MAEGQLNIMRGALRSEMNDEVINRIEKIHNENENSKCILLVPEHYSFETEKKLVKKFGIIGLNNINVMTPHKMAVNFLDAMSHNYLKPAGKQMLIAKAIKQYCDNTEETPLTNAMRMNGFDQSMASLLAEMKRYRIDADMLEENADKLHGEKLNEKVKAIAHICTNYEKLINDGHFTDSDDDVMRVGAEIEKSEYFDNNTYVWIESFDEFLPCHMELLRALVHKCGAVTVCLHYPDCSVIEDEDEKNAQMSIYEPIRGVYERFKRIYDVKEECFGGLLGKDEEHRDTEHFLRFYEGYTKYEEMPENISVFECRDPSGEVEYIASEILKLVRGGMRFRDIGVLFGGSMDYDHILNSVFAKNDIPFFADETIVLSDHPIAMQILSIFDIIENDWNYESVFRYLHAGFIYEKNLNQSGVHRIASDDIWVLENYVRKYGIRGRALWLGKTDENGDLSGKPIWEMGDDIFSRIWENGDDEKENRNQNELEKIIQIRDRITAPFYMLVSELKKAYKSKNTAQAQAYAEILSIFLKQIYIYDGLKSDVNRLENNDMGINNQQTVARQLAQIWTEILSVIDQVVVTSGDDLITFEEFGQSIAAGLSQCEIRIIPSMLDAVYTGTVTRSTSAAVKVLFVAGAVSGTYPNNISYEGFLSNNDREALAEAGVIFAPTTTNQMDMQYFKVYKAFSAVREKLYFSYPVQDEEGGAYRPARVVADVLEKFPHITKGDNLVYDPTDPKNITSASAAMSSLLINCAAPVKKLSSTWKRVYDYFRYTQGYEDKLRLIDKASSFERRDIKINPHTADRLYTRHIKNADTDGRLYSATNIDTYAKCPMMFFMKYGLDIKETEDMQIGANHIGTYAHMLIQTLCQTIEDGETEPERKREKWVQWAKRNKDNPDHGLGRLIRDIVEHTIEELDRLQPYDIKKRKHILRRIEKLTQNSALNVYESILSGEFVPLAYERDFGIQPLSEDVFIRGKIDRIDTAKRSDGEEVFRVIDYKTGLTSLSDKDIHDGINMQLFIYALAAIECYGDKELTGVYYQYIHDRLSGIKNFDRESIDKMVCDDRMLTGLTFAEDGDTELADLYSSGMSDAPGQSEASYIKMKLTAKGTFNKQSKKIKTPKQREEIFNTVKENILEFDHQIMQGNVRQFPFNSSADVSSCKYCEFSDICIFEKGDMAHRKPTAAAKKDKED